MNLRAFSLMIALLIPSATFAQPLMQRTAVASCQATDGGDELEFDGSSYLLPTGYDGVLFHCPLDAALASPGGIQRALVWVGDASGIEEATAQICYTNLNSTPSETCGPIVTSSGSGYVAQTLTPLPPGGFVMRYHAAFLKVYIPSPDTNGYSFFRGFRVE